MIDYQGISSCQNYRISKELPEWALFKQPKPITKNCEFYQDKCNIWNNKHQTCQKYYQYFHTYNDLAENRLQDRKNLERIDQEGIKISTMQRNKQERINNLKLLENRKLQRKALEFDSGYNLDQLSPQDLQFIINDPQKLQKVHTQPLAQHIPQPLNNRAPFLWNKLNLSSNKYLDNFIDNMVIQHEDEHVQGILKRAERDQRIEGMVKQVKNMRQQEILTERHNRHTMNFQQEKLLGLVPEKKPKIIYLKADTNRSINNNFNQTGTTSPSFDSENQTQKFRQNDFTYTQLDSYMLNPNPYQNLDISSANNINSNKSNQKDQKQSFTQGILKTERSNSGGDLAQNFLFSGSSEDQIFNEDDFNLEKQRNHSEGGNRNFITGNFNYQPVTSHHKQNNSLQIQGNQPNTSTLLKENNQKIEELQQYYPGLRKITKVPMCLQESLNFNEEGDIQNILLLGKHNFDNQNNNNNNRDSQLLLALNSNYQYQTESNLQSKQALLNSDESKNLSNILLRYGSGDGGPQDDFDQSLNNQNNSHQTTINKGKKQHQVTFLDQNIVSIDDKGIEVDGKSNLEVNQSQSQKVGSVQSLNKILNTPLNQGQQTPDPTWEYQFIAEYQQYPEHQNQRIARLAAPKQNQFQPKSLLDKQDFRGLLVTEVDKIKRNIQTRFTQKLVENSSTVQKYVTEKQGEQEKERQYADFFQNRKDKIQNRNQALMSKQNSLPYIEFSSSKGGQMIDFLEEKKTIEFDLQKFQLYAARGKSSKFSRQDLEQMKDGLLQTEFEK